MEKPESNPHSDAEKKEKQLQANNPKLQELMLKLYLQTLGKKESEKQLGRSTEKERLKKRMGERADFREKRREKIDDETFFGIKDKYLGDGLNNLVVHETRTGYRYIHSNSFLSAQIWIVDGIYYGKHPLHDFDVKFNNEDDALIWFLLRLKDQLRATEK